MSVSAINLETLVSNAYYCRKNFTYEQYVNQVVDLLYQGYTNFDMFGDEVFNKYNKKGSKCPAFALCHRFLTIFIYEDGKLFQNEYDVYTKWCERCGFKYYSVQQLAEHKSQLTSKNFEAQADLFRELRPYISSGYYQNFVYGIVMLSLLDDSEFGLYTFNGLTWILDKNIDNYPSYNELMSKVYKW